MYRFLRAGGRGGKAGLCKAEALTSRRPGDVVSSLKEKEEVEKGGGDCRTEECSSQTNRYGAFGGRGAQPGLPQRRPGPKTLQSMPALSVLNKIKTEQKQGSTVSSSWGIAECWIRDQPVGSLELLHNSSMGHCCHSSPPGAQRRQSRNESSAASGHSESCSSS